MSGTPCASGEPKYTETAGELRFRTGDDWRVRAHRKSQDAEAIGYSISMIPIPTSDESMSMMTKRAPLT
jgi:hypothetical protein